MTKKPDPAGESAPRPGGEDTSPLAEEESSPRAKEIRAKIALDPEKAKAVSGTDSMTLARRLTTQALAPCITMQPLTAETAPEA